MRHDRTNRKSYPAYHAQAGSLGYQCFKAGGGLKLKQVSVTDDGARCTVEFNCVRWGRHDLTPQAGMSVYERSSGGLLASARLYSDIEAPV